MKNKKRFWLVIYFLLVVFLFIIALMIALPSVVRYNEAKKICREIGYDGVMFNSEMGLYRCYTIYSVSEYGDLDVKFSYYFTNELVDLYIEKKYNSTKGKIILPMVIENMKKR